MYLEGMSLDRITRWHTFREQASEAYSRKGIYLEGIPLDYITAGRAYI